MLTYANTHIRGSLAVDVAVRGERSAEGSGLQCMHREGVCACMRMRASMCSAMVLAYAHAYGSEESEEGIERPGRASP